MYQPEPTKQPEQILNTFSRLIAEVEKLQPKICLADRIWNIPLQLDRKWDDLHITHYGGIYYFGSRLLGQVTFDPTSATVSGFDSTADSLALLDRMTRHLQEVVPAVERDPIGFHGQLMRRMPPRMKFGVMHIRHVQELIPGFLRFDEQLTLAERDSAIALLSRTPSGMVSTMTAGHYFEYCRRAYLANPDTFLRYDDSGLDSSLSGRDLYKRWADGRSGGLPDIPLDSEEAFKSWYHGSARQGGHPWEIYRGGNSTHIDLGVYWKTDTVPEGWCVFLDALASSRMVETIRIALALEQQGLPFSWQHDKILLARLKRDCYIGIVPDDTDISYGWHQFPRELTVTDCIRYDWFKTEETGKPLKTWAAIKGAITWLPIQPLMPEQ